jgi:hypothetical protein
MIESAIRKWVDCTCILDPADGTPCKTCGGSGGWFSNPNDSSLNAIWRRLRMAEAEVADPEGTIPNVRALCEDLRFVLTQLDAVTTNSLCESRRPQHSQPSPYPLTDDDLP